MMSSTCVPSAVYDGRDVQLVIMYRPNSLSHYNQNVVIIIKGSSQVM